MKPQKPQPIIREVHGQVERIVFGRDGFYIFTFAITQHQDPEKVGQVFTAKGKLHFTPVPKMKVLLKGTPVYDTTRNAWNLIIKSATEVVSNRDKAIRVLKEVEGIGIFRAVLIVDKLGDDVLERILRSPNNLLTIGINNETAVLIYNHVKAFLSKDAGLQCLYGLELTNHQIAKIYEYFKTYDIKVLRARCFEIVNLHGIGFLLAARIADKLGVPKTDEKRVEACLLYYASELMNDGSVCFEGMKLIESVFKILQIQKKLIIEAFERLTKEDRIVMLNTDVTGISKILPRGEQ